MTLVIASQFDDGFNDGLRALALKPTIIPAPEDRPWAAAEAADVLLIRPTPSWRAARALDRPASWPGRLRWVHSGSVGVDYYPPWLFEAPIVSCGRGVASDEIADYVIAAIYSHAKNLDAVRAHSPSEWKSAPLGRVSGGTVGIVGFGAIGEAVARRALALGARVIAARRRPIPSAVPGVELDDIARVVAEADHLVLAIPSTAATRDLIGADLLAKAKPTAHLINVGRGAVLDQDALIAALDAGGLAFATLDVTEPEPLPEGHPLWSHPKARLTPHVSSNYTQVRNVLLEKTAASLERFARGEPPTDIVDARAGY